MSDVQTRLEGTTLVVRIPMRFQHRGGRKRIVAPDGAAIVPASKPQPDGTLAKALARAWRWQRMLDQGVYRSIRHIADDERINASYVSRMLRLALLAPDIIERIITGGMGDDVILERLKKSPAASWDEQRRILEEARYSSEPSFE